MRRLSWKFFLACLAGFLLAGSPFPPPAIGPKQPNIAPGGRALAISVNPADENKIMVASESGGLFRSTTHGATWTQVSAGSTFWFTDVTYLPANPNVILATARADTRVVSGGGIWRSTGGGGTWSHVPLNLPNWCDAANFGANALYAETARDRVWVGADCGLAYSDDQGATWSFLPTVATSVTAVLAPTPGRLAILAYNGVRISTDGGSSWSVSGAGLPPMYYIYPRQHNQIAVSPINPDHLYWALNYAYNDGNHIALVRSTDFGTNWEILFKDINMNRPPIVRTANALSGDSAQYDVYYANGSMALVRATADGSGSSLSSWTYLNLDHADVGDVAFGNDHKTPILLATDGGLHKTTDNGQNWTFAGGGSAGYNALQIAEVTGQIHNDGLSADLYFGTQDNGFWASPDEGASWPVPYGSEGVFLNIPRDFYPANQTKLTGSDTGSGTLFISGKLFAGVSTFPSAPDFVGAPRLLKPAYYVQQTGNFGLPGSAFALTTDTGSSWAARYGFPEPVWELPKAAGSVNDPVVYAAVQKPGATSKGYAVIELKRTSDVLGNNTALSSNVSGFGSLGFYPTMWVYYVSFGVDPNDSNYLMVSDVVDDQVKVSTDAGATWTPDTTLTDLVTQSGTFKFSWWPGITQTTAYAFDPDCDGHILVGTYQAGIFETFDRGGSWQKLGNSELIPEVTSMFFPGNGRLVISSYGRGLWKYSYTCPSQPLQVPKPIYFAEPLIFWKGAKVPISEIHDPDTCPACAFFPLIGGKILDYKTDPGTGELIEVIINKGEFQGYTWQGVGLPIPFKVTKKAQQQGGALSADRQLQELLAADGTLQGTQPGKSQIKGLFLEGNILRGLILAEEDLSIDSLPKKVLLGPHISLSPLGPRPIDETEPITVTGVGFDPALPLEVLLDGQPVQPDAPPDFDPQGNFTFTLTPLVDLGGHTILVRQGDIQDIGLFLVTVHEAEP